jgi:CheY-like chemotaxis protein
MTAVLVVDDDPVSRALLRFVLEDEEGYSVHEAFHGGPAFTQLHASLEPLAVLLGLTMPAVDGEAVLQAVAADPALAARHRYIMVTAAVERASTGPVAELRERLDVPLIAKPFDMGEVLAAVAKAAGQLA